MSIDLGHSSILLTGGTGFVGQAILERLLSSHPDTTITLLARPKGSLSAGQRAENLLRKSVFSRWKESVGEEAARRIFSERVRVVEGGLGDLGPEPEKLDLVLHSASSVNFDDPIDKAFATNVTGVSRLYEALLAAGADPHVVHVSTAYVNGARKGLVTEGPVEHEVDVLAEERAASSARERIDFRSRRPAELRRFLREARKQVGKVGPRAVAEATEAARQQWVDSQLVEHGRARAESLGWTDAYTLTKALAERIAEQQWAGNGHRLSVVRPSIIESALLHPYPGWIDGFKVADPLIIAYGRGQLPDFPALPDSVLDIVPVDFVVNAVLAAASTEAERGRPRYFQVTSGTSNPLPLHVMVDNIRQFFTANPVPAADGPVSVPPWQFPGSISFEGALKRREAEARAAAGVLARLPGTRGTRRLIDSLESTRDSLGVLRQFSELYRAYVQSEVLFDDSRTRELDARVADPDQRFDVRAIDWEHYLQDVHLPSITSLTRAFAQRGNATRRPSKALPERQGVLALFDLEGTVLRANLVQQYLWLRQADHGAALWPREVTRIMGRLPRLLGAERRDRSEFIRTFLRLHKGMKVADVQRLVSGSVGRRLRAHVLPEALARVEEHRAAGHRTVLVTGGVDLLAEVLAPWFDEVVATGLHSRDGVLTGFLSSPPIVGEARAAWLKQYAQETGIDLVHSYGYGDSLADASWLQLLGHPVAVNPEPRLYSLARAKHWEVAEWTRNPVATTQAADESPQH